MKSLLQIVFLFLLIFGVSSCKKDNNSSLDMGYNYFPNEVGRYVVYDVDSFHYEDNNISAITHIAKIDTFKFQLKEKIESIYQDNENRPTIRLERYVRFSDTNNSYTSIPWTLRNVWVENRTTKTAEKVEENIRFIKLAFPFKDNQTWNGNAQNDSTAWDYYYDYFDMPRTIAGHSFDSVLNVIQKDQSSLINKITFHEMYARNVGLIYKSEINIESQPPSDSSAATFLSQPIMNRVTKGTQYNMTVNSYGIE
jgi:hypothetical protein